MKTPRFTPTSCGLIALLVPAIAGAYSITNVTLSPHHVVSPDTAIEMAIDIVTPGSPPSLYQPTQIVTNGHRVEVDVFPTSGPLTVLDHLRETVSLGAFPPGNYEYEVRLHPDMPVNWGVRTNHGNFIVQPVSPPPTNRELHVVGVYQGASDGPGHVERPVAVFVDRPGQSVTLFLSAYEPVSWEVSVAPDTILERVFLSGYHRQRGTGIDPNVPVFASSYEEGNYHDYIVAGWTVDSSRFLRAVPRIHSLTEQEIASFHGAYEAPHPEAFVIDGVQDDPRLRSDYPQSTPLDELPEVNFQLAFYGANAGQTTVYWREYTLGGPQDGGALLPADLRVVPDGSGRYFYGTDVQSVLQVDSQTGTAVEMQLGTNVPPLSWPMAMAYGPARDRVSLVSLGSEGFLYGYTPSLDEWSLVASMENRDFASLVYHGPQDALYGTSLSHDDSMPLLLSRLAAEDGSFVSSLRLPLLPFNIEPGGHHAELVSAGEYLVLLLAPQSPYHHSTGVRESRMYLIDPRTGEIWLTYRQKESPPPPPPPVNHPPVAHSQSVSLDQNSSAAITLTAFDPDGDALTFNIITPPTYGTLAGEPPELIYTPATDFVGEDDFTFKANDRKADSQLATVSITVLPTNGLPVLTIVTTDSMAGEGPGLNEFTNTARFEIRRAGNTNEMLNFVLLRSGSASYGSDFVTEPPLLELADNPYTILPLPAGATTTEVTVVPLQDDLLEGPESVRFTLGTNSSYTIGHPGQATAVIEDDDGPFIPVVTIDATDPEAAEAGDDPGRFTVHRAGRTNLTLPVFYFISGTASNGVDYAELPGLVEIPAGDRSAVINIAPIDDDLAEGSETVRLELYHPPIGGPVDFYTIGSPSSAVVVIHDDEPATNQPPFIVNFHTPVNGQSFPASADIWLAAFVHAPEDSHEVTVEFFEGTNSLGFGTFVPSLCPPPICPYFALTWSNVPPGQYMLTARVTDKGGAVTISDPVNIAVTGEIMIHGQPKIVQLEERSDGVRLLHFSAATGQLCMVQVSTNLVDWETLGSATEMEAGRFEFEDASRSDWPCWFYRIVTP